MRNCFLIVICMVCFLIVDCKKESTSSDTSEYTYQIPVQKNDGWETASLSHVNMDPTPIISMMNELLKRDNHGIHSILIIKDSKLVFEEYFNGKDLYSSYKTFGPEVVHCLCSVTKSFTSALLGIALDNRFISATEEKMFSYFPDYSDLYDDEKGKITLHHLLTMTSGLEWDEHSYSFTDPRNDLRQFNDSADPIRYLLQKPVVHTPGTFFRYNGGAVNLLGEIIHRASGLGIEDFSMEYLFEPLGITDFRWLILEPSGLTYTSGDLHLRPRDMAKFGYLFLNGGSWKGKRIISPKWINESTQGYSLDGAYGYLWWLRTYQIGSRRIESYHAGGWGGQFIIVVRELNMVVVFTGGNFNTDGDTPVFSRVESYILPAAL